MNDSSNPLATSLDALIIDDLYEAGAGCPCDVLVLDDPTGALAWEALTMLDEDSSAKVVVRARMKNEVLAAIETAQKLGLRERLAVVGIDTRALDLEGALAELKFDGHFAVGRLPKGLAALDDIARSFARFQEAAGHATVILGGNAKHMSRSMNTVLERGFGEVRGLRGRGKFRCLIAEGPRPAVAAHRADTAKGLHALGGVFAGGAPDRGGLALADQAKAALRRVHENGVRHGNTRPFRVLDLGCGNGAVSAAVLEQAREVGLALELTATDLDLDAVRSTAALLGDAATVTWDDAASQISDASQDLVMLNPPFHEGGAIDPTLIQPLLDAARRVLTDDGVLLMVHNSHLRYRPELERRFARVKELHRDTIFTVLQARG